MKTFQILIQLFILNQILHYLKQILNQICLIYREYALS